MQAALTRVKRQREHPNGRLTLRYIEKSKPGCEQNFAKAVINAAVEKAKQDNEDEDEEEAAAKRILTCTVYQLHGMLVESAPDETAGLAVAQATYREAEAERVRMHAEAQEDEDQEDEDQEDEDQEAEAEAEAS